MLLDQFGRVAHRHNVSEREQASVADNTGVVDGRGAARDDELLARHGLDAEAGLAKDALDLHVVDLRGLHAHRDHLPGRLLVSEAAADADRLDAFVGEEQAERGVFEVREVVVGDFYAVILPILDDAADLVQRVLEHAVKDLDAGVVLQDDVIDVIGRLLGGLHVLGVVRQVLHGPLGAEKRPHEGRQGVPHGLTKHAGDNLAAAVLLVAHRIATVIPQALGPPWADLLLDELHRVVDLAAYYGL